ncbi:hydrolase carbon-nitrogen family [Penicillium hordei]|uniref:Hydrolase carbon-nitrogen family n=1 Tax=Penicillium hordei TaxID=40994 RepID=A0AAD6H2W3_9EURO|nr:hydrolase carbon-nitrogen family [Penicillium hordei]KAJ5606794.1 hydrolase carbon-nitrogen family [Penicillium hordei]
MVYFIDNTDAMKGRYQKKNVWHPEWTHVKGSQHVPHVAFDTPLGKVGVLICWDVAFPEGFRNLISQRVKLIAVLDFWKLTNCAPQGIAHNRYAEKLWSFSRRRFSAGHATIPALWSFAMQAVQLKREGMKIIDLDMAILNNAASLYRAHQGMARPDWH